MRSLDFIAIATSSAAVLPAIIHRFCFIRHIPPHNARYPFFRGVAPRLRLASSFATSLGSLTPPLFDFDGRGQVIISGFGTVETY
jgi:hypothetical protein